MENENTVDPQDETQIEGTFEVDESEDVLETDSDEDTDNGDDSNQHQDEVAHLKAENAKLQRLLKKKETQKAKESPAESVISKDDIERIRLTAKGYEDDEIDLVMELGGISRLENPVIKRAIDSMREEKKQTRAQATSKTQSTGIRKYSQEDLRNMPLEKLEKLIKEGKIKSN